MSPISKIATLLPVLALGFTMAACQGKPKADEPAVTTTPVIEPARLEAKLGPASNSKVTGSVVLEPAGDMVTVKYEILGLKKNSTHALHIHEKGDCSSPDGSSAGGHWNPNHTEHGNTTGDHRHPGDFGNIKANAKGKATGTVTVPAFALSSAKGLGVIVHSKADDFKTQPTGNAGDRQACGVLE